MKKRTNNLLYVNMRIQMNKEKKLLKLATLRQNTRYDGYNTIADYENGFYECEFVSPYSKSAHNVNADVFVVLQDWSSDENMHRKCKETNRLGYTPSVYTNRKLIELLKEHLLNPSLFVGQLFEEAKFVQAASGALGL